MNAKWLPIAAAVSMALSSGVVVAADADNGWEVHGYGRLGGQWNGDGASKMNTLGKQDYRTVTSMDENANQVELSVKKKFEGKNGVKGEFVTRAEYGNQNAGDTGYFVSSEGSLQTKRDDAQFEMKEAYVELAGFDFLDKDTKIWAGQRYLNREQGILTKEFWKQSSGVGAGFQNGGFGMAVVSADDAGQVRNSHDFGKTGENRTATSLNIYYYGLQALGGTFDFDLKGMKQSNTDADAASNRDPVTGKYTINADTGVGASIAYNRDYYGFKGWSKTAIAYGEGMASNRGVNFGSWNGGFGKDSKALFLTSYGVADVTPRLQIGTEVTYWAPQHVGWDGDLDVSRFVAAVQPSYKINDNLRAIFTGSYSVEKNEKATGGAANWFGSDVDNSDTTAKYYALEAAVAFTVDADYWGRPQIKPFVSWVSADDEQFAGNIGIDNNKKSQVFYGVEAEVWF
ncbi:carbohydrate porin [Aeromonas veronii]|nr:carbohydrate porin [Aeromonas veronii]EKP0295283.1 carbohydrate porin [Aeromonas veronii]MCR3962756.1 carbohydrate porin [Aeromonas veronii]MDD1843284.1 carbohydrate porin [Aeromonas veronii]